MGDEVVLLEVIQGRRNMLLGHHWNKFTQLRNGQAFLVVLVLKGRSNER